MTRCSFVPTEGCGLRKILTLGASEEAGRQTLSYHSRRTSPLGGSLGKSLWQNGLGGGGCFSVRMQKESDQPSLVGKMMLPME